MIHKSRIINIFKDAPKELKAMTVGDMLKQFREDVKKENDNRDDQENEVCKKFHGRYLKVNDKDGLFGHEVEYIRVDEIVPDAMTEDRERMYGIGGHRIFFSDKLFSSREVKLNDMRDAMTAKQLEAATVITKELFDKAQEMHDQIEETIKNILG